MKSIVKIEIITEYSKNVIGDELKRKFFNIIIKDDNLDITKEIAYDDIDWAIIERWRKD